MTPSGISLYERVNDFFNINCVKKKVEFMIKTGDESIEIEMTAKNSEIQMTQKAYYRKLGYYSLSESGEPDLGGDNLIDVPVTFFDMKVNGITQEKETLCKGQRIIPQIPKKAEEEFSTCVVYIRPFEHTRARFFLNDILNDPELYQEILDILKEFDPGIISINYDDGGFPGDGGYYKILSKENNRALPLDMYGDGMKKAILLMSAVVKAKKWSTAFR